MITPLEKVRSLLSKNKLDAILISSTPNIIYLTNYSGFSKEEREAYLFITKTDQYILTDGRYVQAVKTLIPNFKLIEISHEISTMGALKKLAQKHKTSKIGFEGHDLSHLEHVRLSQALGKIIHTNINHLRTTKSPDEICKLEKACRLGDKAFTYILKKMKLGVSEKEISCELEYFIKKHEGDISFTPIIAFGKNAAIPHHQTGDKKLEKDDKFVLMDFGIKLQNYCSDMTRTIFFGKPTIEQEKMYSTVLEAQTLAIQALNAKYLTSNAPRKAINSSQIDKAARKYIISQGYETIPHSLGHGIGLEVHENPHLSPNSPDTLEEGMVFSIEPGIYIPEFGGVRIEDLVVLTKNGPKLLTHSPKTLIAL